MANRSYVESVLLPGEKLEYAGQIHWVIFVPGLASSISGAILCLLNRLVPDVLAHLLPGLMGEIYNYLLYTGVALVGSGVLMLGHSYLRLISTELAITN